MVDDNTQKNHAIYRPSHINKKPIHKTENKRITTRIIKEKNKIRIIQILLLKKNRKINKQKKYEIKYQKIADNY